MPRPHHGAALRDGDDGIAVLDSRGGNIELYESIGATARDRKIGDESALIGPDHFGIVGSVGSAVALRNPRVGYVVVSMVLEVLKHISA